MGFPDSVIQQLSQPLDQSRVKTRSNRGGSLSYIEGYDVIDTLNAVFGYDGWHLDVKDVRQFGPIMQATVSVLVNHAEFGRVSRTDVGAAIPAGDSNEALETAIKAAVTDGMKRAARTFGNQFGNSLYDKDSPLHNGGNVARPAIPGNAPAFQRPTGNTTAAAASTSGARLVSAAQVALMRRLGADDELAQSRFGVATLAAIPMSQASPWIDELRAGGSPTPQRVPQRKTPPAQNVADMNIPF